MRLKEDYSSDLIFKLASHILIGMSVGFIVSNRFFPSFYLWSEFFGSFAGAAIGIYRFKVRPFEISEAFITSALPWISIVFLKDSVIKHSLASFFAFIATLLVIFMAYLLDTRYKSFSWYKSGKIGFVGLATFGAIFMIRLATSLFKIPVLSFVKYEGLLSGVSAFVCFLLLVYLARDKE